MAMRICGYIGGDPFKRYQGGSGLHQRPRCLLEKAGKKKGHYLRAQLNFATPEEAENAVAQATAAFERDMEGKKRRKQHKKTGKRAKRRPSIPWASC